jgi:outer membrane protein assembly factor BamB
MVAAGLAVLAVVGLVLSTLDLLEPRAPVSGSLSLYYMRDSTLEAAQAATGAVSWRYTPPSGLFPNVAPASANGMLYLAAGDTIRAVRAGDGKEMWVAKIGELANSIPVVDHDVVYATSTAGVFALRAGDGGQIWHITWYATEFSSAQVANGSVYAAANSANPMATVYALGAGDGSTRWKYRIANPDVSTPAVVGGLVYVLADGMLATPTMPGATLYALGAEDGGLRWKYSVNSESSATLTVANGIVLISSVALTALDALSGRLLWRGPPVGTDERPLVSDGEVFYIIFVLGSNPDLAVLALDARTGQERWRAPLDNAIQFLAVTDGTLYVGGGRVYALRAVDGHVLWEYGTGAEQFYQPVVTHGLVIVGSSVSARFDLKYFLGLDGSDALNALDGATGAHYWSSSGSVESAPVPSY